MKCNGCIPAAHISKTKHDIDLPLFEPFDFVICMLNCNCVDSNHISLTVTLTNAEVNIIHDIYPLVEWLWNVIHILSVSRVGDNLFLLHPVVSSVCLV